MPVFSDLNQYRRDIWMLGSYMLITLGGSEIYHLAVKPMETQAYKIIKVLGYPDPEVLKLVGGRQRRSPSCNPFRCLLLILEVSNS